MNGPGSKQRGSRTLLAAVLSVAVLTLAGCARTPAPRGAGASVSPVATSPVATTRPTDASNASSSPDGRPTRTSSPTAADPYALADGVYPALLKDVDVGRGTVKVDVVQTFSGWRAKQAALDDGVAPWKARQYKYYPVYIRNENPLLRTLSVSPNVTIVFMGECEETTHGMAGLRQLAERALPFSADWYYSFTIKDDVVQRVVQHIAIPAC
jgi:hypothetical protein